MPIIKLFANLRKIAGMKEASITPPSGMLHSDARAATVRAVLTELVQRIPALNGVILEDGELRPHVIVTLNGHNVTDINMQVTEQDVLAIFPPIAGG